MKVHILQHTAETPPGLTMDWVNSRNLQLSQTRFFLGEKLPRVSDIDFLIICGGGMGANDDQQNPWLISEKQFIKECVQADKAIFGLCLGAQLIAKALGGNVEKNSGWEIGWHDVEIKNFGRLKAFQYHQDTFSLPPNAELIATNPFCKNQAYVIGEKIIATQFHPEADERWINELAADSEPSAHGNVQTPQELLDGKKFISGQRVWFFSELDRILENC